MAARTLTYPWLLKQGVEVGAAAKTITAYDRADGWREAIDAALDAYSFATGAYGVEAIEDNQWADYYLSIGLLYANTGDGYGRTLIYDTRVERWSVTAWADYIDSSAARRRRFADR